MPFIGVIAKESDNNFIKKEFLKNVKSHKYEILNINKKSIENIKNIRFDVILINDDLADFLKNSKYLEDVIINSKYLIINSDIIEKSDLTFLNYVSEIINNEEQIEDFTNKDDLLQRKINIITYGLNRKATITMSSIKSENILICVQNKFKNYYGEIVEEQEVNVEIKKNNLKKICNSMAIFTILTIFGENMKKI